VLAVIRALGELEETSALERLQELVAFVPFFGVRAGAIEAARSRWSGG